MSALLLAAALAAAPAAVRPAYFVVETPAEQCVWPVRMTGPDLHMRQSSGVGSIAFAALAAPVCRPNDVLFADSFDGAGGSASWSWTLHRDGNAPASYSGADCALTAQSLMDRQSWFVVLACAEVAP